MQGLGYRVQGAGCRVEGSVCQRNNGDAERDCQKVFVLDLVNRPLLFVVDAPYHHHHESTYVSKKL